MRRIYFIGAPKCATTSLYNFFKTYPTVNVGEEKTTNFFFYDYIYGRERYDQNYGYSGFPGNEAVELDFNPNNCIHGYVPDRIRAEDVRRRVDA